MDIDAEQLIRLVEERPSLWDKSVESYRIKAEKEAAWNEICLILNDNFDELQMHQQQAFASRVLKKWTHTRDNWLKSVKKRKNQQNTGLYMKIARPYVYHKQLLFLKKMYEDDDDNDNENVGCKEEKPCSTYDNNSSSDEQHFESSNVANDIDSSNIEQIEVPTQSSVKLDVTRKRYATDKNNPLNIKKSKRLHNMNQNRYLLFFRGLLPSLNAFNDEQALEFQASVIKVVQQMKTNIKPSSSSHTDNAKTTSLAVELMPSSPSEAFELSSFDGSLDSISDSELF